MIVVVTLALTGKLLARPHGCLIREALKPPRTYKRTHSMSSISSSSSVEPPETESVSGKGGAHDDALVEEDLFELARSLCGSIQPEDGGPDASGLPTLRLNYDVYCIVRSDLRPRLQRLLSATTFLKVWREFAIPGSWIRSSLIGDAAAAESDAAQTNGFIAVFEHNTVTRSSLETPRTASMPVHSFATLEGAYS